MTAVLRTTVSIFLTAVPLAKAAKAVFSDSISARLALFHSAMESSRSFSREASRSVPFNNRSISAGAMRMRPPGRRRTRLP